MAGHSRSKNGVASLAYAPPSTSSLSLKQERRGCPAQGRACRLRVLLRGLRLERGEVLLAAEAHDRDLVGAVDGNDHLQRTGVLGHRDVARLAAAGRQVEARPLLGGRVVTQDAVGGPHVEPGVMVAVDRDMV